MVPKKESALGFPAIFAALLLLAVALAGCLGDDDVSPSGQDPSDDGTSESTGAIEGDVMDGSSLQPITNSTVSLVLESELVSEVQTDAEGAYRLENVEPGEYRLQVVSFTHKSDARGVQVEAGETEKISFLLEPFPSEKPFSQLLDFDGLMAFGKHSPAFAMTWGAADENHQVSFNFNVTSDLLRTIVVELYWDESHVGLRANLWKNPNCNPVCSPDESYTGNAEGDIQGFGEIRYRVDHEMGEWAGLEEEEETLTVQVWSDRDEEPATVAYQQQFKVYIEAFYVDPAPEGYVAAPDS